MPRKTRSLPAMLMLAVLLGTSAAYARPSADAPKAAPAPGALTVAWDWLNSLLHGNAPLSSLFAASGSGSGGTLLGGATTMTDGGGFIDPNGGGK